MAKSLKSVLTSALVTGAIGLAALLPGKAEAAPGQIKIGAYPVGITNPQGIVAWAPDGTTEYEVQIRADSTEIPTNIIKDTEWDFIIPTALRGYMQHTRSSLPDSNDPSQNPTDFWYNIDMDDGANFIDDSMDGNGELDYNGRLREFGMSRGTSNRTNKVLGSYFFTLSTTSPRGYFTNSMDSIYCYDENNKGFVSIDGSDNASCNVDNQPFQIIPEPAKLGFFASLLAYLTRKKN